MEAYCVKCKEKREMVDAKEGTIGEGNRQRRAMKGKCSVCGTNLTRILPKA